MEIAITAHIETLKQRHPDLAARALEAKAIETLAETGCSYSTWLRYEAKFERQYDRAYKAWLQYQEGCKRWKREATRQALREALIIPAPVRASAKLASSENIPEPQWNQRAA